MKAVRILLVALVLSLIASVASGGNTSLIVGISLQRSIYSQIEFSRANIHPQPAIIFSVLNATFLPTAECFTELADRSISGPRWVRSLIRSEGILSLTRPFLTPAPKAGDGITPQPTPAPFTIAPPSLPPGTVTWNVDDVEMLVFATRDFTGSGSYRLRLPSNCSALGIEFAADFIILSDLRTALGKVMTFCLLLFAGFSALLALLGSPTMLTVAQCIALLSYSTCGSLSMQEESTVLRYILVPFVIPFTPYDSCNTLLVALGLCVVVSISEALRELWERIRAPPADPPALPSGGGGGPAPRPVVARGFARIVGRRPLPPHFALAFFLALYPGIFFYGVRTMADGSSGSIVYVGLGLFSVALAGLGSILLPLRIIRHPTVFFCDYTGIGMLPLGMLPLGVWGPQKFRQQFGAPISDFGRGRKGIAPLFALYIVVLAGVCSTTPGQTTSCQSQLAFCVLSSLVMLVALIASRPFRSTLLNVWALACFSGVVVFSMFQFLFGSYYYLEPGHWTGVAAMGCGIFVGVVGSLAAVCHLFVAILELASGMSTNAIRDTITLRGRAGMLTSSPSKAGGGVTRAHSRIMNGGSKQAAAAVNDVPETVVSKMMMEIVAHHQQDEVRKRRIGTADVTAVVDGDRRAPSLADYLLQDFEELPQETRDDFVLAVELEEQRAAREAASLGLVEPMIVHPSLRPQPHHVAQVVESRAAPPYVQAVTLNKIGVPRPVRRMEEDDEYSLSP